MQLEPLDTKKRLDFLLQNASGRFVQFILRHRYVTLAFALNVPGNAIIGGGGISFTMGFIRLFTLPEFAITVSLAVLPFPIIVFLTGANEEHYFPSRFSLGHPPAQLGKS